MSDQGRNEVLDHWADVTFDVTAFGQGARSTAAGRRWRYARSLSHGNDRADRCMSVPLMSLSDLTTGRGEIYGQCRTYTFTMAGGRERTAVKEADKGVLKWYTQCFICRNKVRCRDEKVARGSKKCINLLKLQKKR